MTRAEHHRQKIILSIFPPVMLVGVGVILVLISTGGEPVPTVAGVGLLVGVLALFAWLDPRKAWADVPLAESETQQWLERLGWDQDAELKEMPFYVNDRMANTGPAFERSLVVFPKGAMETWSPAAMGWRLRTRQQTFQRQRELVRRFAAPIFVVIVGVGALAATYVSGSAGLPLGVMSGYVAALYLGMWIRRRAAMSVDAEEAPRLASGPDRAAATEALTHVYRHYARSSPLIRGRGCRLVRMRAERLGLTLDGEDSLA